MYRGVGRGRGLGWRAGRGVGAQDRVVVRLGNDGSLLQRQGTIVSVDRAGLVMEVDGRTIRIDRPQLVEYRSPWDELSVEGDRLFEQRQYELAFAAYGKGLEASTPAWVRRRLLAGQVRTSREMGAWLTAAERFVELIADDADSLYWPEIPLAWTPGPPDPRLQARCDEWLRSPLEAAALLGASHAAGIEARPRALERLQRLTRSTNREIAALAQFQLWQRQPPPSDESELIRREERLDDLEPGLRAGPHFLLSQWWSPLDAERGVLQALRVALLYRQHEALAAHSLLAAGRSLMQQNRRQEARIVLTRLVTEREGTREAESARPLLEELQKSTDTRRP